MIGTVRNVGYKFVRPAEVATSRRDSGRESSRGAASSSPADSEDNVADLERRFNAPS
jgi:DNA-binding winged helix-turn-helix (wHTH) protein